MEKITSAANPAVKRLKTLLDAKGRKAENAFLVEGEVMIREALSCGLKPLEAFSENETELPGVPVRLCSRNVLEAISDTKTPQGIIAAFELPERIQLPQNAKRLLALDGVQDPGNIGTILRTADASGFEGVLAGQRSADVYSPKVQRAAMGSGFRVPVESCDLPQILAKYRAQGYKLVISALDGVDLYQNKADYRNQRLILVIGNEARGVSPEVQALADIKLKIPMRGRAESLNAAVAAGILMYELTRPQP